MEKVNSYTGNLRNVRGLQLTKTDKKRQRIIPEDKTLPQRIVRPIKNKTNAAMSPDPAVEIQSPMKVSKFCPSEITSKGKSNQKMEFLYRKGGALISE